MEKNKLKGISGILLFYVILGFWSALTFITMGLLRLTSGVPIISFSFLSYSMIILGCFWIYTLIQIIIKRKKAIDMTIYLLWVAIIIAITGQIAFGISNSSFIDILRFLLGTCVYIFLIQYFKKSERVKNTLIN